MTYRTYVSGHSNDIVHLEGDRNDERYVHGDDHIYIGSADIHATYDGEWSFDVSTADLQTTAIVLPNDIVDKDRFNDYTEVVVVEENHP